MLVILGLVSFSQFASANQDNPFKVTMEPISAGIKAKSTAVHGTDVAVINYTNNYVDVFYDNYAPFTLYPLTSARITNSAITTPVIAIKDYSTKKIIFPSNGNAGKSVSNYATLSIYFTNGIYTVYETNNP